MYTDCFLLYNDAYEKPKNFRFELCWFVEMSQSILGLLKDLYEICQNNFAGFDYYRYRFNLRSKNLGAKSG